MPDLFSQPLKEKVKPDNKQEKIVFNLDDQASPENSSLEEKKPEVSTTQYIFEIKKDNEEEKRKQYMSEQAQERIKKLKSLSSNVSMNPDELKEKLEVPAYMRKNVDLKDYPHSSERNISRFNLNDDNEIMGNNKFLHDNVD
jgi:cell division protein FtsZ